MVNENGQSYFEENGYLFSDDADGHNRAVICKALQVTTELGRVIVRCGKHSAGFPAHWLTDAPKRVVNAVDALGAEVRRWNGITRVLVAWIATQCQGSHTMRPLLARRKTTDDPPVDFSRPPGGPVGEPLGDGPADSA